MDILTEKIAKEFAELKRLLFRATYNRLEPTISSSQGELLFLVASHQSQTMKELATKLGVSSGAITQLVDGLAVHHLLERKHDDQLVDLRFKAVKQTQERAFSKFQRMFKRTR
jgi:DNA-binding MarR family transcriptional regulator